MEEKKINKRIVFSVVAVLLLIAVVAGATYAYFSAGGSTATQTVTSGTLELSFTSVETITAGDLTPIMEEEAGTKASKINFTVKNNGSLSTLFNIDLNEIVTDDALRDRYFRWQLLEGETMLSEGSFVGSTTSQTIKKNLELGSGASKSYTVLVYIEESGSNQNAMQGKEFSAKVRVSSVKTNEGWNASKGVNAPELADGMIPVKWNDGSGQDGSGQWVVCASNDPEWYDYANQKWANVMLSDGTYKAGSVQVGQTVSIYETGSMFVWIPRYEYKIDNAEQTIDVKFIPLTQDTVDSGYTYVHPAFTNDIENGGWDSELSGIWFAKYQAGYQANTINTDLLNPVNEADNVVLSKFNYTSTAQDNPENGNVEKLNAVGQDIGLDNYATAKVSYPVFKASTYTYNLINISDMYNVAREVGDDKEFYGLNNADSHLTKNSEWGAAAYLAHSKYGRNGVEVSVNSKDANPGKTNAELLKIDVYTMTGYTGDTKAVSDATSAGSTTGNMTGIFDMSGASLERVAMYSIGTDTNNYRELNGFAFTQINGELNTFGTKYATPYDIDHMDGKNDTTTYNNFKEKQGNIRYGDAVIETIITPYTNNGSWYSDGSKLSIENAPFTIRGGRMDSGVQAGIFHTGHDTGLGNSSKTGFRVVIVAE